MTVWEDLARHLYGCGEAHSSGSENTGGKPNSVCLCELQRALWRTTSALLRDGCPSSKSQTLKSTALGLTWSLPGWQMTGLIVCHTSLHQTSRSAYRCLSLVTFASCHSLSPSHTQTRTLSHTCAHTTMHKAYPAKGGPVQPASSPGESLLPWLWHSFALSLSGKERRERERVWEGGWVNGM